MAGFMRFYSLPKKEKAREKNDSSITVHALQGPLRQYMAMVGHRNVWQMLDRLSSLQYNAGTPHHSILRDFAPLALLYVKVCRKGMVPSLKHRQALTMLNAESVIGQGTLKINFTDLSDEVFIDQIDDRIRVLLKHFRICVSNSCGIQKQRRLHATMEPEAYQLVEAVLAEFDEVSCVTAPVAVSATLAIEDTPAMQLVQQAVDSQESMTDSHGSSVSMPLSMVPSMHLSMPSSLSDDGYTLDPIADGSEGAPSFGDSEYTLDPIADGSEGAPSFGDSEYTLDPIADGSEGATSAVTSKGATSAVTSKDPIADGSEGVTALFENCLLTPEDAQRMMDALQEVPKFQEESHNTMCIKNMKERKGKRKNKSKKNGATSSTKDEASTTWGGQEKNATKKKKAAKHVDDASGVTNTISSTKGEQKKKKAKKKQKVAVDVTHTLTTTTTTSSTKGEQEKKAKKKGCTCG